MTAGPVEYKRKYTLWVLVVLIIVCWPVAIIYYFTRERVPVQELQTYAYQQPPPPPGVMAPGAPMAGAGSRTCSQCGAANPGGAAFCAKCGAAMPR